MPRPKAYRREDVVDIAMRLFWERGYHDVSTRDLVAEMGLNAHSLYAEFGSKAGLFAATIERYERDVVPGYIGHLETPGAGVDTVRAVCRGFTAIASSGEVAPGCLIINSATERAPTAEESRHTTARYLDRLNAAIAHALDGQPEAEATARFLTATLVGLFVMIRARTDPSVVHDAVEAALDRLPPPSSTPIHHKKKGSL